MTENTKTIKMRPITVGDVLNCGSRGVFDIALLCGEEYLSNPVTTSKIQKPGLLLTGLPEELHANRIQILGGAEMEYLKGADANGLKIAVEKLEKPTLPCLVITRGLEAPEYLIEFARRKKIPILTTKHSSSVFIERLSRYLEDSLAPVTTLHGVLVDVMGVGLVIIGKSGIGKSECALELISKGHRLVADDIVIVKRINESTLMGTAADLLRYHMEIRGLGIVNIRHIFGITAIKGKIAIDMVVEMFEWRHKEECERLGFDESTYSILGVELPYIRIPVTPGRSVANIVEVSARNRILKLMGYNPTMEFQMRFQEKMDSKVPYGAGK